MSAIVPIQPTNEATGGYSLDLFSTSQKRTSKNSKNEALFCHYNAPFFAYQIHLSRYGVTQGCCNHWDCPRCGQTRARQEYGRIVSGIRELAKVSNIYFATITAPGKEMTQYEADEQWPLWSNRLFSSWRTRTKSHGGKWCYVAVTERQKRGHAHSHILTTAYPMDIREQVCAISERKEAYRNKDGTYSRLRSDWLRQSVIQAGMGEQYDISLVASHEAASRYIAKYLFKQTALTYKWPKGWKRVRYSQSWPKMPDVSTDCMVLLSADDWRWLGKRAAIVKVKDVGIVADVRYHLRNADTIIDIPSTN